MHSPCHTTPHSNIPYERAVSLECIGVNVSQMACILLTKTGSQVKYTLRVSEQIQKRLEEQKDVTRGRTSHWGLI